MKENKDEPILVTIHMHMEMSQRNLCSYLKQGKMSLFSFYPTGGQIGHVELGEGLVPVGGGGGRERYRRVNVVQIP
jgi:diketogulonate reductase-like aldo/keto reductase